MPNVKQTGPNPLHKYFRQPKIYINLPSNGNWYPEGAIEKTENNEYPVFAMTAKDELAFKTPDALLNGQSVVTVVQSCVPNIKDAWNMPTIDVDALLIAIRIATYGEKLEIKTKVPVAGTDRAFDLDLRMLLDKYQNVQYDSTMTTGNLKTTLKPQTYREFTRTAIKTFEEQRINAVVNDQEIPDAEKLEKFAQSFNKLTNITIDMVSNSIVQIQADDTVVVDKNHIAEFIAKGDKSFFTDVVDHLSAQKEKFDVKPFNIETTAEEREAGAPESFEVPITFDQSNFFA